jgi:hypothetical protein
VGSSTDTVSDLAEIQDGNEYHIDEANGVSPAMDLKVDFINVTKFNFVHIMGYYAGGTTHSVNIQLYAWSTSTWHTWESHDGAEETMRNHSFHVPCGNNYIGTGGDDGKVRVRFLHTQQGINAHDLYIESVALYDLNYRLDRHWGPWR